MGLDGVDVSVSDRGIGIDKEQQQRIFDHFYRVDDPSVRKRRGTPLALRGRAATRANSSVVKAPLRSSAFSAAKATCTPDSSRFDRSSKADRAAATSSDSASSSSFMIPPRAGTLPRWWV